MKIQDVKTSIKVCSIFLDNSKNKKSLKVMWHVSPEIRKDQSGRVYLICVNDEIFKIGGSLDKGGIERTINTYASGNTGNPGPSRFTLNYLMKEEIEIGNKVDVYLITSMKVLAKVKGLFEEEEIEISAFKEMENKCIKDFFERENKFPIWNFQEGGKGYQVNIEEKYIQYKKDRIT